MSGHNPSSLETRMEAVGGTRASGEVAGTHRCDLRRPKGPDVCASLAASSSELPIDQTRPIGSSNGDVRLRPSPESPLRSLSEASVFGDRLLTHTVRAGKSPRSTGATKVVDRLATHKPRGNLTLALFLSRELSQVASDTCLAETWPGDKRGRAKLALVYHRRINGNFVPKIARSCSGPPWSRSTRANYCVQGNRGKTQQIPGARAFQPEQEPVGDGGREVLVLRSGATRARLVHLQARERASVQPEGAARLGHPARGHRPG